MGTAVRGRFRLRAVLAWLGALVLVGGLVLAGAGDGYPKNRPQLLSGAAWLASSAVGQLTLLDGASAEVAGRVQVAPRGNQLDVVQQGATAYAVDRTAGQVRRVDGATFEMSQPASPLPGAGDGLRAIAATSSLFVVDTRRGVLVTADLRTLTAQGSTATMTAQISPQAMTLDAAGRLWVLDTATGDLVWFDHGRRQSHRDAIEGDAGAGLLSLADGAPVLIDTRAHTIATVDPESGDLNATTDLDIRDSDRLQVVGSVHSQRLYVVSSRGTLAVCELTAQDCTTSVPIADPGAELGAPVESGNYVFVPDYRTGRVWIVELSGARVVASPKVLDPNVRFQLLNRDGIVFFNDPASEHAGVIRVNGDVRQVSKYTPDQGLVSPRTSGSATPAPSSPSPAPPSTTPPRTTPPAKSTTPAVAQHTSSPPPAPPAPRTVRISVSTTNPVVGQAVNLQVAAFGNPAPSSATWRFGDGQSGNGMQVSHSWGAAQAFQVSVTATFPNGQTAVASLAIQVVKAPIVITAQLTAVNGSYVGICDPPADATSYQATISVSAGPVTVRYRVRNNDRGGSASGVKSLTFSGTGPQTQTVIHQESGYLAEYAIDGTLTVEVTAPTTVRSNTAPYHLQCTGPGLSVGNITGNNPYVGPCPHRVTYELQVTIPAGPPMTFSYHWRRTLEPGSDESVKTVTFSSTTRISHTETFTGSSPESETLQFIATGPTTFGSIIWRHDGLDIDCR